MHCLHKRTNNSNSRQYSIERLCLPSWKMAEQWQLHWFVTCCSFLSTNSCSLSDCDLGFAKASYSDAACTACPVSKYKVNQLSMPSLDPILQFYRILSESALVYRVVP